MNDYCGICGRPAPDLDRAVDEGWVPCFWFDDENQSPHPCCPVCLTGKTDGDEWEPILSPGVEPYSKAVL